MPMRKKTQSVLFVFAILFALESASGQQANQSPVSLKPAAAASVPPFFNNHTPYSWDQVFYGSLPRPRKMSRLVERARQTSTTLARGLGFVVFEDKPFGEIIDDYFGQQHELDIVVDWKALAAASPKVTPDSTVNVNLSRGILEDVLADVLDDLSRAASDEDDILAFYVLDGRVKVSTQGEFAKLIVTRIYNISYLARGTPYFFDAPELGMNHRIPFDLAEPPPYLNLPAQAGRSRNPRRNFEELRDELIHLLKEFQPQSWKDNGGRGTISMMGNALMIRQTCEVHEFIGGRWW